MNEIVVTNTLTRHKEVFTPRQPGEVTMYVCGVTTYDESHLGHARPAVVFDVIRRFLRLKGLKVRMVQNFTDVDDKIIARANQRAIDTQTLAQQYCDEYLASMDKLGVQRADVYPKVSEHIKDIINMVQVLIDKGSAYAVAGDVWFSIESFPEYGKLSNQRLTDLQAGTRFSVDENKRHPLDFALWKAAKPGEPAWESPWGPGRPGWHIECSTMALKYLGNHIDIHGGGVDLVFPHHENEVAQSEAYTGAPPFARYWLHNGLVNVEGEKMSKSLGNFVSVKEALTKYPAALLRYYILSHHYRNPLDFNSEQLTAAGKAWERLNQTVYQLEQAGVQIQWPGLAAIWEQPLPDDALAASIWQLAQRFDAAMSDDFNTAGAIGVLFEVVAAVRNAQVTTDALGLGAALGFLYEAAGELFGFLAPVAQTTANNDSVMVNNLIALLVELRTQARQRRDWASADNIRQRLNDLGVTLEDTAQGTNWSFTGE